MNWWEKIKPGKKLPRSGLVQPSAQPDKNSKWLLGFLGGFWLKFVLSICFVSSCFCRLA
jgi:hypothetical protein